MGNTRVQGHGLQLQGQVILSKLRISLIESTETHRTKVDFPKAVTDGLNTHMLTGQQIANVDAPGIPVNQAAVADAMRVDVAGVGQLGQSPRIGPGRTGIEAPPGALGPRPVRAFGVVVVAERIEAPL